ncbi:DUF222 domain-containing protein [uncultured Mycolicibacterium sp.]|uniref:DUF222 domain-containing protein n=1 Tax=uncultured Mycolicibacterium sp. TaxID=2320817 RepID=UPI00261BDDD6|nr:DUF222 domain-containing protein [uncultured Mycolicibacterium sp.]
MSSTRDRLATAIEEINTGLHRLQATPPDTLSRTELQEVIALVHELEGRIALVQRRMVGRLVATGAPGQVGATSWAPVLARRLRISPAQAQRMIADAAAALPPGRPPTAAA